MRGKFIVFEGSDGSGKTTILNNIKKYLDDNNYDYVMTREPGGTKISESIRENLLSNDNEGMSFRTEALLFAAARAQHVDEVIKPNLEKGRLVISDRFVMSSLAYQAYGRELGYERVKAINDFAIDGILADHTIFFNVDPITVLNRKKKNVEADRLESEDDTYHKRVYEGYQRLIKMGDDKLIIIDASKSIEEVTKATIEKLLEIIGG
ncbi:MAG: dTMP kinase [Tissierellia bacterium]|nr:dTMP kinase [Tissierellia bacterium]